MKIMLILPPMKIQKKEHYGVTPPLGIAYLAAVLEKSAHEVRLLDCIVEGYEHSKKVSPEYIHLGLGWGEIEKRIRNFSPEAVGISCVFSLMAPEARRIAEIVKAIDEDIVTVMGGAHPSAMPEEILLDENVDFVILGEGERTFPGLLNHLEHDLNDLSDMGGLGYKSNGQIKINLKKHFIEDLDSLPYPAWHLLPMKKYHKIGSSHGGLKRNKYASMITSRGCVGKCIYCAIHSVWGPQWRSRSPKSVVDEMEYLVNTYGIREIHFEDDNLTLHRRRAKEIFQEIVDRGLDITWTTPNGVAAWTLDEDILQLMKKSGCYQLNFGIESGNERVLKEIIGKPLKLDKVRNIVKKTKELGIWAHGFFILGLPGETKETMEDTIKFAIKLDLDSANFFIATPYPGTRLYEICRKNRYIPEDFDVEKMRVQSSMISTEQFTSEELLKLQRKAYQRFMIHTIKREIRPKNILYRLRNTRSIDDLRFMYRKVSRLLKAI